LRAAITLPLSFRFRRRCAVDAYLTLRYDIDDSAAFSRSMLPTIADTFMFICRAMMPLMFRGYAAAIDAVYYADIFADYAATTTPPLSFSYAIAAMLRH